MGFVNRNLVVLFVAQTIFVSGSVLVVTVGGIAGYQLAPDPAFATLPVALMVVGTALTTVPAALLMQRVGRRFGFMIACGTAASGATLATFALAADHFIAFCGSTSLVGASLAFSQQFRFAAAESVATDKVGHAVSFILIGSIAGAFVGPQLVAWSAAAEPDMPYRSGFGWMVGLYAVAAAVLILLKAGGTAAATTAENTSEPGRPLLAVARQPLFITAVLAGVVGQGVMTYVMTATPISMTVDDGFSVIATSEVIRAHVIAMYLPSLVTPWLIARLGLPRLMSLGAAVTAGTLLVGLAGQHLMHYWFAMVLLGVGWNFLFVGGTTLLVQTYRPEERYRAQACNDFSVFGASAIASLMAGTMLHALGWEALLISALPALVLILLTITWSSRIANAKTSTSG